PSTEVGALIDKAIAAQPTSIRARLAGIDHLRRQGDSKAGVVAAQKADAAIPNNPQIMEALGMAQQATGDANQALATYNRLAAVTPQSPLPYARIATVHYQTKDYGNAVEALKKALSLQPKSLELKRDLVGALQAAGRHEEALSGARGLQKDYPKDAGGWILEGDVFVAQRKWSQAESAYREALKRGGSPLAFLRLHSVLGNSGKASAADAEASKWLNDNPKDVVVRLYLGERDLRNRD